jgi:gluconate 2-dehydrogenase gamma chain
MAKARRALSRGFTRRQFLANSAKAGAAGVAASALPLSSLVPRVARGQTTNVFTPAQRATLDAALGRMIPAVGPGDWSAADAGAGDYIEQLLSGTSELYAGGPGRAEFSSFQQPASAKQVGWSNEIARLRDVYESGLADLDTRAGGDFTAIPAVAQDAILSSLDDEGSPFFAALYDHTMEGVYAHPVYGGNKDYVAWNEFCYEGDVHFRRYPAEPGSWNTNGGYSPQEMGEKGADCP